SENHSVILPRPLKDLIIGSGGTPMSDQCTASNHFAEIGEPIPGTNSCPPGASRRTNRQLQFFRAPSSIRQGRLDVLLLQIRIEAKNFSMRVSRSNKANDSAYRYPHTADARLAAHDFRVTGDARILHKAHYNS